MQKLLALLIVAASLTACKKDDPTTPPAPVDTRNLSKLTVTGKHLVRISYSAEGYTATYKFNFNDKGVLTSITGSGIQLDSIEIDANTGLVKKLLSKQNPLSGYTFTYNSQGLVESRTDFYNGEREYSILYTYLEDGRISKVAYCVDCPGNEYTGFVYNGNDRNYAKAFQYSPKYSQDTIYYTYTTARNPISTLPYIVQYIDGLSYPTYTPNAIDAYGHELDFKLHYKYDADGDIIELTDRNLTFYYTYAN